MSLDISQVFLHNLPSYAFFLSPFTVTVLFRSRSLHFLVSLSLLWFCLSHSISPLTPPPSRHCASHSSPQRKKERKENGKTANPAASYGIRVYQSIMPFSDLFSSQDRSLCACIPPPPHTHPPPFPYRPTKAADAVFSAAKTSCNVTPTPTSPLIVIVVSTLRGVCQKLHT